METFFNHTFLRCSYFAEGVSLVEPLGNLEYGYIYVLSDNFSKEKMDDIRSGIRFYAHKAKELRAHEMTGVEESVQALLGRGYNLIMPVYVMDDCQHYHYLIGKIDDIDELDSAADEMFSDVGNIMESGLKNALVQVDGSVCEDVKEIILSGKASEVCDEYKKENGMISNLVGGMLFNMFATTCMSVSSFRGMVAGAVSYLKNKTYAQVREKILKLPKIIAKMQADDEVVREKAWEEFKMVWDLLSKEEQQLMFLKLAGEVRKIKLKKIVTNIADRDELGKSSQCSIVLYPWKQYGKEYGFKDYYNYCPFVKNADNKLIPIKMEKCATVIYFMSLIEKKTAGRSNFIVDVDKNKTAFHDVYQKLFNSYQYDECEKKHDELLHRSVIDVVENSKDGKKLRAGRLNEYYSDIEKTLSGVFHSIGESSSPYVINSLMPLAIVPEKIDIPEEFLKISIK